MSSSRPQPRSTSSSETVGEVVLTIQLKPETWILSPIATKEQLRRYAERGWISKELAEHLDRAFPRNADGKPILFKAWLLSPMKKACDRLGYRRDVLDFEIIDEHGNPVDYIVIPEQPLVYKRAILIGKKGENETKVGEKEERKKEKEEEKKKKEDVKQKKKQPKQSLEVFEYIDGTYTLKFRIKTKHPKELLEILALAGKIGLMGRVKYGYGRFRVIAEYHETI